MFSGMEPCPKDNFFIYLQDFYLVLFTFRILFYWFVDKYNRIIYDDESSSKK